MKNQNSTQDQNLDQNQNTLENEELDNKIKDKIKEDMNESINNSSRKVTLKEEELIITTERNSNTETNLFASICGNSKEYNTKEKGIKQYLNSDELKTTLNNAGLNDDASQKVIEKLNEYLEKYESNKITLDKLKNKVNDYFTKFKSANKNEITKGNINEIQKQFSSCIDEECKKSNTMETHTFRENFSFEVDTTNNNNKDETGKMEGNQTFGDTSPRSNYDVSNLKLDLSTNNNNKEEIEKMAENQTTTVLNEQSDAIDEYKIKLLIEIYENTFGHKISPATKNLIIDLVLETEKYIEDVTESVRKYQIEEGIKKKILEAIAKSTSKESVEKNINELEDTGGFEIASLQKQAEDEKVYSKMLGKAKATCNKVYNKYYGYSDLPKKQIDKIAEYAYQRYIETKDVSSKREEFNKSTTSKLKSNSDLEGIGDIKKFVESRGYTAENYANMDFYEINQGLTMQLQDDDDVVADIPSGYCDLNCYTIAAASALLFAMSYMLALDNEVSYHGFGPSGF